MSEYFTVSEQVGEFRVNLIDVSAGLKAPIVAVLSYGVFSGVTSYKGEEESKSNKSFLAIRGYPVSNARSLSLPRITYPL